MLNISSFPLDSIIAKKIEGYNDNKELNRIIGYTPTDITGSDELGSLMTDAILL